MIFPTAYFPSIHYVKELCRHQKVWIDHHEHWIKQSIRNRCEILGSEGILRLTVPISHQSEKQSVGDVRIGGEPLWGIKHWRAIKTAYGKSPYFDFYDREIEAILLNPPNEISVLNAQILQIFIEAWELPVSIGYSNEFKPYEEIDFRQTDWLTRKSFKEYQQVFSYQTPFMSNLSALDLLMCEGPMGRLLLLD